MSSALKMRKSDPTIISAEKHRFPIEPYPGGWWLRTALNAKQRLTNGRHSNKNGPHVFHKTVTPDQSENLEAIEYETITEGAQLDFLKEDLFRGYKSFPFLEIYVHGSWADETQTAFSDLDDLILIDYQQITSLKVAQRAAQWLNEVDMRFCRLDPLQHHGHWMVDKATLQNYDDSYMPLSVLKSALCISGKQIIRGHINKENTQIGAAKNLQATLTHAKHLFEKYLANRINAYEMKQLIGSILILPAYTAQSRGLALSKPAAIEQSHELFSSQSIAVIETASAIRVQWHKTCQHASFNRLKFASRIITNPHLMREFSQRASPRFRKEDYPELSSTSFQHFTAECAFE